MRLFSLRPVWAGVLVFAAGCSGGSGDDKVEVKGKLLMNGNPAVVDAQPPAGKSLPPGATGRMQITFYPVKDDAEPLMDRNGTLLVGGAEQATVESDGTFHLGRGKGAGVKKGKYRIVITQPDPFGSKDLLKGAFDMANSKINREVDGKTEIVIDLSKPNG